MSLPLIETTLLFQGKILTRRQSFNEFESTDDELFFVMLLLMETQDYTTIYVNNSYIEDFK